MFLGVAYGWLLVVFIPAGSTFQVLQAVASAALVVATALTARRLPAALGDVDAARRWMRSALGRHARH